MSTDTPTAADDEHAATLGVTLLVLSVVGVPAYGVVVTFFPAHFDALFALYVMFAFAVLLLFHATSDGARVERARQRSKARRAEQRGLCDCDCDDEVGYE